MNRSARFAVAVMVGLITIVAFSWAQAERGQRPGTETQQEVVQAFTVPSPVTN
jgi:hypothetical protein